MSQGHPESQEDTSESGGETERMAPQQVRHATRTSISVEMGAYPLIHSVQ